MRPTLPLDFAAHQKWRAGDTKTVGSDVPTDPTLVIRPEIVYNGQVENIPPALLVLLQACWDKTPAARPHFLEVVQKLAQLLQVLVPE